MSGIAKSKKIVLLISHKTLEGIYENAHEQEDNVLLEYPPPRKNIEGRKKKS